MKTRMRAQAKLITAQLLSGAGIASGYAVGGLLAEEITGKTSMAGIAQMSVILGAGLIAYPLAVLAGKAGRRTALTLGFGIGALGATVVLLGVAFQLLPLFMLGMMMCGSATASGLQARYAAVDLVDPKSAGRAMSLVVWATTVGSVLGPSFTEPGAHLGAALGMNELAGPYLISMTAFGLATLVASTLTKKIKPGAAEAVTESTSSRAEPATMKLGPALRFAIARPVPLFAMITIIAGQMMMTNVMVMTPVHMDHQEFSLGAIGIVVSVHIAGMYALSPVFGWMADRFGPGTVIAGGVVVFATAITLGVVDAAAEVSSMVLLSTALIFLGIGWSMFLIGGSALLTASVPQHAKVTLQGASDSAMNLGGALMAGMAGTVLQAGGFLWINMMATIVLLIALAFSIRAVPLMRWPGQKEPVHSANATAKTSQVR
ncbi:MFS transporter [Brevibacterium sp.]|uniref:MFS transporter n=1 Tax=Brevibacterium sp. TaxID=1701 RepID=UPI002647A2E0|nr:MFS transporter [Brevibacterium sp.]MDN5806578.1 MFS transporter [Brevibacterium sp.]MDN6132690.1 MFS transporter [Brevibacterium sp.]MDN6157845.1 MFS transporter [Brevibacterium sp.]MDN6188457.1 MFS transporter [Brevibacterium sp.]MDN6191523.1 MFS transporter [Brevibacterium sp.]